MKKRLTAQQFDIGASGIRMSPEMLAIARSILVDGHAQKEFVSERRGKVAISLCVSRVWRRVIDNYVPPGYERVSAVLNQFQAFQVRRWHQEAMAKIAEELSR